MLSILPYKGGLKAPSGDSRIIEGIYRTTVTLLKNGLKRLFRGQKWSKKPQEVPKSAFFEVFYGSGGLHHNEPSRPHRELGEDFRGYPVVERMQASTSDLLILLDEEAIVVGGQVDVGMDNAETGGAGPSRAVFRCRAHCDRWTTGGVRVNVPVHDAEQTAGSQDTEGFGQ